MMGGVLYENSREMGIGNLGSNLPTWINKNPSLIAIS